MQQVSDAVENALTSLAAMGQPVSRSMCCSVRDKDGKRPFPVTEGMPHFVCSEVDLPVERPLMLAFAPLWHSGTSCPRRMALASEHMVHVYRMSEGVVGKPDDPDSVPTLTAAMLLEHTLSLGDNLTVTALLFRDEDASRHLTVAYGPASGSSGQFRVRIWTCESGSYSMSASEPLTPTPWRLDQGYVASLDDHSAAVTRLAVSSTFLLSSDKSGECRVWQKTRSYAARASARLHQGAVADLVVDRLFAYSVGCEDLFIRVWSLPDLKPVLAIPASNFEAPMAALMEARPEVPTLINGSQLASETPRTCRISTLTAVRRPTSRWSGAQGSGRNSTTPRGMLFVAGTLAEGQEIAGTGAGVLMEFALSSTPVCQSLQIAHDSPIVVLAHGPYDNGPLVTGDAKGVFRVWDYTPRLWCSQQVDTGCSSPDGGARLSIAVDPLHRALYSIVGDKRLFVWRQHTAGALPGEYD